MGMSAAKSAAKTQAGAAQQASDQQLKMFETIRGDLSPYRSFGATALPGLSKLLGLDAGSKPMAVGGFNEQKYLDMNPDVKAAAGTEAANVGDVNGDGAVNALDYASWHSQRYGGAEGRQMPTYTQADVDANPEAAKTAQQAALEATPGYKFARDQGVQQAGRVLGTKGLTGAQIKGVSRFVTGLADQTYADTVKRYMDVAGMGQSAANQTGAYGQSAATNSGNALIGGANASAAGTVGAANALGGAVGGITNGYLTSKLLGGGGGGSAGLYGTALANSGNMFTGSYGGGDVPY
jgi:hypothetical protein